MPLAAALGAITGSAGAGLNIYGQFRQQHQQNWENGLVQQQNERRTAAQDRGVEAWNASSNPARDSSLQLRDLFMAALQGDQGSQSQLTQILQRYPEVMEQLVGGGSDPFGRGTNGAMSSLMGQNEERRGAFTGPAEQAFGNFSNGGMTPGRQTAQERFMDMLNGQGAEMGTLGDVGTSLLGGRGQTSFTQNAQDRAGDSINRGGMDDQLQRAWAGTGRIIDPEGALGTAGLTEAGGAAEWQGLQDVMGGGRTDLSSAMGGRGMELAGKEALLPMEQVVQFAGEDAARNTEGVFKRAQRQAAARKGTSGAVVAAGGIGGSPGAESDPFSEYADQAARHVSDSKRQAMLGQQSLQLQQQGQGFGAAGNAAQAENARYGSAADLVKGMEGQAANRYLGTLGLLPQISNASTNRLGTFGNLGLGAGSNENSRMNTGINSLQGFNQNRLGAGNLMRGSQSDADSFALGNGQLGNNLENSYQNTGNNLFNQNLAGGQFGAGLNQQQLAAFQQYFGNTQGVNRDNYSNSQGQVQNLFNLGGQGLSYAMGGLGGGTYQPPQHQQNPWAAVGQAVGNINLGGLFPPKGDGGPVTLQQPLGQTWTTPPRP